MLYQEDYDGDGVAELRKVTVAGDAGYEMLDNEAVDHIPFCALTPIPMPHRFYGRSVAELVQDVQLVKSTVMRQLLDNMYLTNNNRVAIMDGMVNLDDLLTSRPGGGRKNKTTTESSDDANAITNDFTTSISIIRIFRYSKRNKNWYHKIFSRLRCRQFE